MLLFISERRIRERERERESHLQLGERRDKEKGHTQDTVKEQFKINTYQIT
jgi:hypothetical protein